ncbi:hypothetical protein RCH14_003146 [Massilia sp. MP_M2]
MKLLAATTNASETGKKIISAVLRTAENALEAVGGESGMLKALGGEPQHHPLGETYFSQTPYLYGQYMAKLSLVPVAPELLALDGASIKTEDDAQCHAIGSHFASKGGEWELRVQLNVDVERMPIEDASVEWPQELSPFIAVARVRLAPQTSWDASLEKLEDEIAYDQWNCLVEHRPLGSVNRARRQVMATSRAFRSAFNRCPIHEPSASLRAVTTLRLPGHDQTQPQSDEHRPRDPVEPHAGRGGAIEPAADRAREVAEQAKDHGRLQCEDEPQHANLQIGVTTRRNHKLRQERQKEQHHFRIDRRRHQAFGEQALRRFVR